MLLQCFWFLKACVHRVEVKTSAKTFTLLPSSKNFSKSLKENITFLIFHSKVPLCYSFGVLTGTKLKQRHFKMNEKDEAFAELIVKITHELTELIAYSSTTATIEALKQQDIELTKEQKEEIYQSIKASNAKYLDKYPLVGSSENQQ